MFSSTTRPISTKLGTKHSSMMDIQVCSKGGPGQAIAKKIFIDIQKSFSSLP